MSAQPIVKLRYKEKGEQSTVQVILGTTRFTMTQAESRALINELAKVTLMPPRAALIAARSHIGTETT